MVLGKVPIPGRLKARAYCAWRGERGLFGHFFFLLVISLFYLPAQYRLKYCLKGSFNPKQPTN